MRKIWAARQHEARHAVMAGGSAAVRRECVEARRCQYSVTAALQHKLTARCSCVRVWRAAHLKALDLKVAAQLASLAQPRRTNAAVDSGRARW